MVNNFLTRFVHKRGKQKQSENKSRKLKKANKQLDQHHKAALILPLYGAGTFLRLVLLLK
ncbi:MAG: hypothetical protein DU429_04735 [Candidatus Tokpelaia sp.]|nr:MAG: hypothetical protein DU429_04735 [Candidatus Tokpelaia sp.]